MVPALEQLHQRAVALTRRIPWGRRLAPPWRSSPTPSRNLPVLCPRPRCQRPARACTPSRVSIAGATAWLESWRNGKTEEATKPGSNAVTVPRTGAARLGFQNTGATDTILPQTGAARLGWRPQGQSAGQEAGAATGQGMAQGLAGEAPAVQSEMQQIMNILRQLGAQGVWVPVHPQAAPSGPAEAAPAEKPLGEGGIGHRATGGPVDAYSHYYVGERGPELFVPGQSGTIVPNSQLGGGTPPVNRTVTMNPTFHVTGGNTEEVVQRVVAHLDRMYQEAARGLMGDYGLDTA